MERPQLSCVLLVLVAILFGIQFVDAAPMIAYQVGDQLRLNPGEWLFQMSIFGDKLTTRFFFFSQTSFGAGVFNSDARRLVRKTATLRQDDQDSGRRFSKIRNAQNEATKNRVIFLAIEIILSS